MTTALTRTTCLIALMLYSTISAADAGSGELFGYVIGDQHNVHADTPYQNTPLIKVITHSAVKPTGVDQVFVLVTPMTNTIGKIAGETWYQSGEDALVAYERFRMILRQKYDDWESEEEYEQHFHFSRFWSGKYELNVEVSGPHEDDHIDSTGHPFRFRLTLGYLPGTTAASNFESMVSAEVMQAALGQYSEEDVQGL